MTAEPIESYTAESALQPSQGPDGKFLPGNRVNPGGRPKAEFSPVAYLRAKVQERHTFLDKMLEQAEEGKFQQQELILGYLEGKPVQRSIEVTASVQMDHLVADLRADIAGLLPDVVSAQLPSAEPT